MASSARSLSAKAAATQTSFAQILPPQASRIEAAGIQAFATQVLPTQSAPASATASHRNTTPDVLEEADDIVPEAVTPRRSARQIALSAVTWLLLVVLGVLAVLLSVVPWATHGAALTVLTGSMRPTIQPGDVAVVAGVSDPSTIDVGDVITFMPFPDDPTLVTHRVIGAGTAADGTPVFTTQGDANNAQDEPVMGYQVRAKLLYTVPWIGKYTKWGQGHSRWLPAAIGVGLLIYAAVLLAISARSAPADTSAPAGGHSIPTPRLPLMAPRHCRA
ncbi:MAG: signal peptidase I [Bifidobacteriaceae bacterium]|jgi:signal peptidase|nr:signal peptidase I [Bifidobacteriaceae bacterium]